MVGIIIFGWGNGRRKDQGPAIPFNCPNCKNTVMLHYFTVTNWFSLFFIPLIPLQTRHLMVCPICTRALKVEREHVPLAKQLVASSAALSAGSMDEQDYEREVQRFWANATGAALPPGELAAPPRPTPSAPPAIPPPPSSNGDAI